MSQLRLSGTVIGEADDSIKEDVNQFEESGNRRSLADESQHRIVDMLDKALSGEDPLSEVSESDGDNFGDDSDLLSLSTTSHDSSNRRSRRRSSCGNRRKSSFGGEIRNNMFAKLRKHRLEPKELAELLRKYYDQDKELRRMEADLADVQLPIDFDKLTLQEAADHMYKMMEEVEELQNEVPEKMALNHQADLDQTLMILKNEYNKVESLTSPVLCQGKDIESEDHKAMIASARRIREKIAEIESLKEELRDKVEEVRILENIPTQGKQ